MTLLRKRPQTNRGTAWSSSWRSSCFRPGKELKIAIGYDCRHDSQWLANTVADVISANNIKVVLFEDLRPTPELSFAVNYLKCDVGIVLTASHNPPEYNGYKVYWSDGGQIVPPQDAGIINEVTNGAVLSDSVVLEPLGLASPSPASSDCVGRH